MRVCVIGGSTVVDRHYEQAHSVGRELGRRGHSVVCGGLTGVMEGVCEGAVAEGGHTIGILPGADPAAANPYVETAIATGLGNARNALVVLNAEAAIAVDGAYGTLSEIALALDADLPVATLDSHDVEGVVPVDSASVAVDVIEDHVQGETAGE